MWMKTKFRRCPRSLDLPRVHLLQCEGLQPLLRRGPRRVLEDYTDDRVAGLPVDQVSDRTGAGVS